MDRNLSFAQHRAVLSRIKGHRSKKFYNNQLTRWFDRPITCIFSIKHLKSAEMGLVN